MERMEEKVKEEEKEKQKGEEKMRSSEAKNRHSYRNTLIFQVTVNQP